MECEAVKPAMHHRWARNNDRCGNMLGSRGSTWRSRTHEKMVMLGCAARNWYRSWLTGISQNLRNWNVHPARSLPGSCRWKSVSFSRPPLKSCWERLLLPWPFADLSTIYTENGILWHDERRTKSHQKMVSLPNAHPLHVTVQDNFSLVVHALGNTSGTCEVYTAGYVPEDYPSYLQR